jgi:hypothetical protein
MTMMRTPRWYVWMLLPVVWAGSLRAAVRPMAGSAAHCASGAEAGVSRVHIGAAHAGSTRAVSGGDPTGVRAPHHCPGCQQGHCPDMAHCLTAGSLATAPHVQAFGLAGPFTSDRSSPDDRPLSANPTPPIPPPQLAL